MKMISVGKLEVLRTYHCELSNDFHEIIEHCINLKQLTVFLCESDYKWLYRKYPTLEHLTIVQKSKKTSSIEGIPSYVLITQSEYSEVCYLCKFVNEQP